MTSGSKRVHWNTAHLAWSLSLSNHSLKWSTIEVVAATTSSWLCQFIAPPIYFIVCFLFSSLDCTVTPPLERPCICSMKRAGLLIKNSCILFWLCNSVVIFSFALKTNRNNHHLIYYLSTKFVMYKLSTHPHMN